MTVAECSCGWRSKPMTPRRAEYAARRHSCEMQAVHAARAERVAARKAACGPLRDCQHPKARHQHGTRNAYVLDRCRCRPCRDAASQYERWRTRQRAYGREAYVDAAPARRHVEALRAAGMGLKLIAKESGVPHGALTKLVYGDRTRGMAPSKRIHPATEQRLLAVEVSVDNLGAATCIDATGTHRRLQALVCLGWSQSKLAAMLGMEPGNLSGVLRRPVVHASTARKVRGLYDELWKVRPPEDTHRDRIAASRARNHAAQQGWKPPLWWDEDEIDSPAATAEPVADGPEYDEIAIERAMAGEDVSLTKAERLEAVRRLLAAGLNKTEIARRLKLSGATVNALLARAEEASHAA